MAIKKAGTNPEGKKGKSVIKKNPKTDPYVFRERLTEQKKMRIYWLKSQMENDHNIGYTNLFKSYQSVYNLSMSAFYPDYRIACNMIQDEQELVNEARLREKLNNGIQAIKKAHKTKDDRIQYLQDLIDATFSDLDHGVHKQERIIDGKAVIYERKLTPIEKVRYRDAIKGYISEICKINGEYAPKRISFDSEMFDDMNQTDIVQTIEIFTPDILPLESEAELYLEWEVKNEG